MNERIKELFNQAGGQGAIHPLKYNGTLNVELFAELLIKECADLCAVPEYYYEFPRSTTTDSAYKPRTKTNTECAAAIKEHFGVE